MLRVDRFALLAVFLFIATQGVLVAQILFASDSSPGGSEGTAVAQFYWAAISALQFFGATLLAIKYQRKKLTLPIQTRSAIVWLARGGFALAATTLISCLWSADPAVTFRRGVALSANLAYGISVVAYYGRIRMSRLVFFACAIPVVVSVLAYAIGSDWARMENAYRGAARGLYSQKNVLGMYCWIALIGALYAYRSRTIPRKLAFTVFVASTVALLASQSMTSILAATFAVTFYMVASSVSKMRTAVRAMAVTLIAILGVFLLLYGFGNLGSVAESFGRDATLTGRSEIWRYVVRAISDRPIAGYGYGAFWRSDELSSYYVANAFGYQVSHSHNSLLDVILDIGVLGAVPVASAIVLCLGKVIHMMLTVRFAEVETFWAAVFLGLVLTSLSEPIYLVHNSFATLIFWVSVWIIVFNVPAELQSTKKGAST